MRTFHSEPNFDAEKVVRDGVESGRFELWHIDGESWAVTQTWEGEMFLWCYQGKGLVEFVNIMMIIAARNKLKRIKFATRRPAIARMIKHLNPVRLDDEIFVVEVN